MPVAGPLPGYAADLRPQAPAQAQSPASTSLASSAPAPASPPAPAAPSSAPVTSAAGHSGAGHPTVLRRRPPAVPAPPPGAAVAARAVAVCADAASANGAAENRLRRLVNAVARQQPRLAWLAGDRADDTTILSTDLAGGWIPPGIDLPSAVTLPHPAHRDGSLESLLGDITAVARYTPTQDTPDGDEPPATSPSPRLAAAVGDLGWELTQATRWRDGLPRLAHTLAKAAATGTGVLDSELRLLRGHIETVGTTVLDSYPDDVDAHDVGNWQLLAGLEALIDGDETAANYHLAWFLAGSRRGR
ncbi:MAG: DUF5631 domain-containing protein [Mycobacterium sp.]